jgi:hypothetical protein
VEKDADPDHAGQVQASGIAFRSEKKNPNLKKR